MATWSTRSHSEHSFPIMGRLSVDHPLWFSRQPNRSDYTQIRPQQHGMALQQGM
jgi:hypothetical protein